MRLKAMFPVLLAAMMLLTTEACGLSIPDSATTDTSNTTAATQSTTVSADATPTVTPLPSITADSLKLVYEDDFSSVDWLVSTSEDVSYSYQDGKYVVTVTDEDYMHWSYAPLPLQSNFMAQVQANDVTPSKDTKYFIVFRLKESGSGNEYYTFEISDDYYLVRKHIKDDWVTLQHEQSEYIKTDGSTNELKVACLGNFVEVHVNGQRLVTLRDDSLKEGYLALGSSGMGNTTIFDNFKLYHFTSQYIGKVDPGLIDPAQAEGGITAQSVPPSGGKVTITDPTSVLNGFEIDVPAGAYTDALTFNVSYSPAPEIDYPDVRAISPLITIDNGGSYAERLMTVKIPARIPKDEFALAFIYDAETGQFEGIPLVKEDAVSITITIRRFINIIVLSIKEQALAGARDITTGFLPGRDDWEMVNYGSYITPGGNCAGMSLSSLFYFDFLNGVIEEESPSEEEIEMMRLNGMPLLVGENPAPDFWVDDVMALQLVSVVQQDYIAFFRKYAPDFIASRALYPNPAIVSTDPATVYDCFRLSMLLTGQPQMIGVSGLSTNSAGVPERVAHAMVAYAVSSEGIWVADPNDSTHRGRLIRFEGGQLLASAADGFDVPWDYFWYTGKGAWLSWDQVETRFDEIEETGDSLFPDYTITLTDGNGRRYNLADYDLETPLVVDTETIDLQITAEIPVAMALYDAEMEIWAEGGAPRSQWTIDTLHSGDNPAGFLVMGDASTVATQQDWRWVDFKWVNIQYQTAVPSPTTATPYVSGTIDGISVSVASSEAFDDGTTWYTFRVEASGTATGSAGASVRTAGIVKTSGADIQFSVAKMEYFNAASWLAAYDSTRTKYVRAQADPETTGWTVSYLVNIWYGPGDAWPSPTDVILRIELAAPGDAYQDNVYQMVEKPVNFPRP